MNRSVEWRLLEHVTGADELVIEITKRDRRSYSMKLGRAKRGQKGEIEAVLSFVPVTASLGDGGTPNVHFPADLLALFDGARKAIEEDVAREWDKWQEEKAAEEAAEYAQQRGSRHKFDSRSVEEANAEAHPGYVPRGTR